MKPGAFMSARGSASSTAACARRWAVPAAAATRAARRGWDAAGVDFAYDLWEGGYPDLLRTRRLVRRTAVLSSTAASSAAAALALLARESRTGPSGGGDSSNTAL